MSKGVYLIMQTYKVDENGLIGTGVSFMRIRRITGYLVGTVDRFNNAKQCELRDRLRHDTCSQLLSNSDTVA